MKPEAVFFGLAVAAPVVCQCFARTAARRWGLSVTTAAVFMSVCLSVGEARASAPDFDIVFGIALAGWTVLAMIYSTVATLVMSAIVGLFKRLRAPNVMPRHEE